jgi:hypothetical protein
MSALARASLCGLASTRLAVAGRLPVFFTLMSM